MISHGHDTGDTEPVEAAAARRGPPLGEPVADPEVLRTVLRLTTARIAYFDNDGRFRYATPAYARSVGAPLRALIGRTMEELGVPLQARDQMARLKALVEESGQPATETMEVVHQGIRRDTEVAIVPVRAADGTAVGAVVTSWDVTILSEALRRVAQLDRVHSILSDINQAIVRLRDRDAIFQETCRIAAEIGGFELAWVGMREPDGTVSIAAGAGRNLEVLRDIRVTTLDEPEGRGVVGTAIRENRAVVVGNAVDDDRMAPWKDKLADRQLTTAAGFPLTMGGSVVGALALYTSQPDSFDEEETALFEELASDISYALDSLEADRRREEAEAALRDSEQRYRDMFEKNPNPMWVYDAETLRILAVNDSAVHSYGYTREEFLSLDLTELRPPDEVPAMIAAVQAAADGFRPRRSWRHVRKDGSIIDVEVTGHDVDFDGRRARLVSIADVTERRRLEAQLAEATRMEAMGHLAGGIAHDFNNLLMAVNGYAELLVGQLGDSPLANDAREIRRAGLRAAELTHQVLAFARRQVLAPRAVDVNVVVGGITQMLGRLIGEQVKLVTVLAPEPAVVMADPGQLEQVLVNLAINSRDAMPGGGKLEIRVATMDDVRSLERGLDGPAVLITVRDTGTGMTADVLAHAFEPFYTTKQAGSGTGLGLATVHGIVHQSNGEIWAESGPDTGTTISVLFRRVGAETGATGSSAPAASTTVNSASSPATAPPSATVLVVEDEAAVRGFVVSTLERAGYRVLVAGSPAEAVALTQGLETPIDVLLTDLVMPDTNGRDLAQRLVELRPNMRVIVMSGYGAGIEMPLEEFGRFLAKPFGRDEVVDAVAACVAESRETRPAESSTS